MRALLRASLLHACLLAGLWAGREFVPQAGERFHADELVIRLKRGVALNRVNASLPVSLAQLRKHPRLDAFTVKVPPGLREAISRALGQSPLVDYVEPHRVLEATGLTPSDPSLSSQWWLTKMQAAEAWSLSPARFPPVGPGNRIRVAILDTGADCTHTDFVNAGGSSADSPSGGQISFALSQAIVPTTIAAPACPWQDDHGHGTHVAGTVAAATNNAAGVAALGFPAELMIFKVLDKTGSGDEMDVAEAITAAADAGARVISLSLGGSGYSQILQDAVDYAWERNALVVAATGNSNTGALFFPAGANYALGVGASDSADARASFSNYGFGLDVIAPGVGILSTAKGGGYVSMSGTSMATPQVSALAALIMAANPGLSAEAVAQRISAASDVLSTGSVWNNFLGYGRVNAWRSLSGILPARTVGGLVGQVVDSTGVPIGNAQVTLNGVAGSTDAYGLFRFVNFPAGTNSLLVSANGYPARSLNVVLPAGADAHARVELISNVGTFTGAVLGAGSVPVPAAVVQILAGGLVVGSGNVAANGVYSIQVPEGTYDLRMSAPGYVSQTILARGVTAGAVTTVDFTAASMGRITGIVRDGAAIPISGVQITVTDGIVSAGAVTDAAGAYTTIGIPAGTYTVTAAKSPYIPVPVNPLAVPNGGLVPLDLVLNLDGTLSAVTLSPTTVGGGASSTANTVTLSAPAGAAGVEVFLSSSNTAVAQVPASVIVPSGATKSAPFTITTNTVAATTPVTIQATRGAISKTAALSVVPFLVTNLALSPATLAGGATAASNRVYINYAAPAAGITVTLSSADPALVTPPPTVVIPAGATYSATFPIPTARVATTKTVALTAVYGASSKQSTMTLNPAALSLLSVSPTTLAGGKLITTASVKLDGPAPAGGAVVSLQSSHAAVNPPATVTIPEGAVTSANFTIPTNAVPASTPVVLTASYGAVQKTANVTINPTALSAVSAAASVISSKPFTGTVTLDGPAATPGVVVNLTSSDAAVVVPGTVIVPTGATTATYSATTVAVSQVTLVTISAIYGSVTKTAKVTVNPAALSTFSLATTVTGGKPLTGTVTLSGAAVALGQVVTLSSSNQAATVPASVTVAGGATSATFTLTTSQVASPTQTVVTAISGGVTKTITVTINPPVLSSLSLSASVTGGKPLTGTVTLTAPALPGGQSVALTNTNVAASVPASVTVAAGATTATFTVTTIPVASSTAGVVGASNGGVTKSITLTVIPAVLSSMSLSVSVTGGKPLTGTVYLTGPALAGGQTVTLTSSHPAATVPVSVSVPGGASSVTFPLTSTAVANSTPATIGAASGGVAKSVVVTVLPPAPVSVTMSPSTVKGGNNVNMTITLNTAAPVGGLILTTGSTSAAAIPPASATISAGATSATFPVATTAVLANTPATISVTYAGVTKTTLVTVTP